MSNNNGATHPTPNPADAVSSEAQALADECRERAAHYLKFGLAHEADLLTRCATALSQPASVPASALTDEQIDALDTFALHVMAPQGRSSVRDFARAVLAAAGGRP